MVFKLGFELFGGFEVPERSKTNPTQRPKLYQYAPEEAFWRLLGTVHKTKLVDVAEVG